ncbi:MAG: ABC transporter permease [Anaerolineae bacterium]|jgi:simple sugar transport system permease protein|nr:ABC transporter permease [Anaerolineae bacterium]MBT3714817.1 ABC transporter permease [Anaerolineae bacterium]MBT4310865.1 ABC transporter permease [Anaerolineae bacterium]MBT4459546.1 ABC transporter permease [Anaerolineae bacterium]MBT4841868.1 ABC transporter permease [Anaerolineae bacterium]
MEIIEIFDTSLLNSTLRMITPILLAALGGLLCTRAGVFNIALEGLMLTGAFTAVVGSFFLQSSFAGVMAGVLGGMLMAALFGLLAVRLSGNMIALGVALNFLAMGLTTFLSRAVFGVKGVFSDPRILGLNPITIPVIDEIPILGSVFSGHSSVVYLSWLLVIISYIMLFHHPSGLRLRGVGEKPQASATLGVNVKATKFIAVILSGALCGLAGAQLSLGQVTLFVENMSAGRGWIAVVAVMFGQAHPLGVFGASALFGFFDALGFRLQGSRLPFQFSAMIPYLATLAGLFIIEYRRRRRLKTASL